MTDPGEVERLQTLIVQLISDNTELFDACQVSLSEIVTLQADLCVAQGKQLKINAVATLLEDVINKSFDTRKQGASHD